MPKRKPNGACLLKHTERKYKLKECAVCGNMFKPIYPAEKTCCNRCRAQYRAQKRKEKSSKELMQSKIKNAEYRRKHYFCEACGKPLSHGNQKICFACMIDKYKQGDRSRSVKQYFYNRGYTADEIDEMATIE